MAKSGRYDMKRFASMFLGAVFFLSFASAAWGAQCLPGTLYGYINFGSAGCTIGSTLFSDFASLGIPNGAVQIDPSAVDVIPLNGSNGPGLTFIVDTTASAGDFFDVMIGYLVSNSTFSGITLSMTGSSVTGDGSVTTIEDICLGGAFGGTCGGILSTLILFDIVGENDTVEQLTFPSVTSIGVIKDIGIDGGPSGTGSLQSVTNEFTVQEPATIMLVAAGLGYLGICRRRRT
jgi:hypothetical protein